MEFFPRPCLLISFFFLCPKLTHKHKEAFFEMLFQRAFGFVVTAKIMLFKLFPNEVCKHPGKGSSPFTRVKLRKSPKWLGRSAETTKPQRPLRGRSRGVPAAATYQEPPPDDKSNWCALESLDFDDEMYFIVGNSSLETKVFDRNCTK